MADRHPRIGRPLGQVGAPTFGWPVPDVLVRLGVSPQLRAVLAGGVVACA